VLAGVPDLVIAEARGEFHGLYIEMKRQEKSRVSSAQQSVHMKLRERGYDVVTCYGAEEAWDYLREYLKDDPAVLLHDALVADAQTSRA
jgi:hypothetical protein